MRRLAALVAAGAALWLAPGALAAGWCGTGETAVDLPDATTGQQIHAVVAVPADGADTFAAIAPRLADDAASLSAWWTGQDPTRAPRIDQAVYPGGTCADISFFRLSDSAALLRGASFSFDRVVRALEGAGFTNAHKKYLVYYDGPSVQQNVCGTGAGDFASGPGFAVIWLQGCPGVTTDAVAIHELLHALGALPAGAPHACAGDPGHPCDAPYVDVLSARTDGRPLQQQQLDVGHDDYYAHSGLWNDLQDSVWLRHLELPQVPLSVAPAGGAGSIAGDLPGLDCAAACTTLWDAHSAVTLTAHPAADRRFVRWSGACAGSGTCTLVLDQPQSVTAVFGPRSIALRVSTVGRGSVRCTPACTRSFPAGEPLTLRAVAAKGWAFSGWSGSCAGKALVCRPKTSAAVSARATFRRA